MDGQAGIELNVQALKRILVALVAMAGLGGAALPRHLHRSILRLLRPAESAARRLIIALAASPLLREAAVMAAPARKADSAVRQARHFRPTMPPEPSVRAPLRRLSLPLLDPLKRMSPRRARQTSIPRLWISGATQLLSIPVPVPPGPDDPLDATRLGLRLDALGRALDDLPGQALRFARWQARRVTEAAQNGIKTRRRWPLRPGRPPGSCRRGKHEVHAVLTHANQLARWALERRPDTS